MTKEMVEEGAKETMFEVKRQFLLLFFLVFLLVLLSLSKLLLLYLKEVVERDLNLVQGGGR